VYDSDSAVATMRRPKCEIALVFRRHGLRQVKLLCSSGRDIHVAVQITPQQRVGREQAAARDSVTATV
jgi:hypothetical protein